MIRFAKPEILYFLLGIPFLLLFFWWVRRKKQKLLARFGDIELVEKLVGSFSPGYRIARRVMFMAGYVFLILALARPQLGTKLEEVKREGVDLMVAIDVSRSMQAEDVSPSRMAKARHELKTLIDRLQGDRVGIIPFAGDAYMACPLTTDYAAARMILDAVDVGSVPEQGTAIARSIEVASKGFVTEDNRQRVILLLTDGEDHEGKPQAAAKAAAEKGIIIYAVGIGSPGGVPIPVYDEYGNRTGYLKDDGEVVTSKLDELTLQKVAFATDGKYYPARPGAAELDEIISEISGMERGEIESKIFTNYEERFQWALIPAFVLLILSSALPERKKRREHLKSWWR